MNCLLRHLKNVKKWMRINYKTRKKRNSFAQKKVISWGLGKTLKNTGPVRRVQSASGYFRGPDRTCLVCIQLFKMTRHEWMNEWMNATLIFRFSTSTIVMRKNLMILNVLEELKTFALGKLLIFLWWTYLKM